jgi:MATE family multidrug resistance protein
LSAQLVDRFNDSMHASGPAPAADPRERRRRILRLAGPVMAGMVSQTVLNLVDTAMVGRLGATPLAAVGLASYLNVLSAAFVMGMAAGVQALAAQAVGAGRSHRAAHPLDGGLLLAVAIGVPSSAVMIAFAPEVLDVVATDPEVRSAAVPYLRARQVGVVAIGMNFAFRGYWNAVERPTLYLRTVVLIHATNIFLNWILIFGNWGAPALGALGAGIASAAAQFVGTASYFVLARRHARDHGFMTGLPGRTGLAELLRIAAPAGFQQVLFFAGFAVFFATVERLGPEPLAACTVLINLALAWILPANAFGLAAASFAGQAWGARDREAARRWVGHVVRLGVVIVALLALPAALQPDWVLRVFLHEPRALELARFPLQLTAGTIGFDALGIVLLNAHLGIGATRRVLTISTASLWLVCLPVAYWVGPVGGGSFAAVWSVWVGYRLLAALLFAVSWGQVTHR